MGISPDQWRRVKELYEIALECRPSERIALLRQNTNDELVREEVLRLLAESDSADGFVSAPPLADPHQVPAQPQPLPCSIVGRTLGHYRVVEKIAAGGMGVVYKAHDEELDRDVALKVLPAGSVVKGEARKRFRQEALALAKLNHPNIETVHGFGTQDGIDFLCMELIDGVPLSQKLRKGPLSQSELFRLALQFIDGLAAAHEHNIVHRDLKPGNIMVMPDGRLKILDFGLAKLVESGVVPDLTLSTMAETGRFAGTIPYMSPEQLRGLPVDPRSDIFSAGAVLYEMATGQRPFPQLQSAEVIGAILHKAPKLPSSLNLELPPGLDNVICKALEKDPELRYHTARELKAALEGISVISHRTPPGRLNASVDAVLPHSRWQQVVRVPVVAIPVLAAIVFLYRTDSFHIRERIWGRLSAGDLEPSIPISPVKARKSVAVIQFKNVSDHREKDWQSTEIAEMLTTELAAGEQLRTISGEDVAQARANLNLPDTDSFGEETLQRLHKNLNVDFVISGNYVPLPDGQTRVDVRLQDAAQGITLASVSRKNTDVEALATALGADLREKIGVGVVSLTQSAEAKAAMPSNAEARRRYSEGLAKLRVNENVAARNLLQKAVLVEPSSAVIHSALGEAYTALGYDEKARQSARNAFDLSSTLSRQDRLLIEARYRQANKEWDQAIESYRTLFGFFPDNLEYGILLADSQISAGKAKDALYTIEQLRGSSSLANEDPRVDLVATRAFDLLGSPKDGLRLADTAASKAQANGSNLLRARAHLWQAQELESLTELDAAKRAAAESQAIYHAAGDLRGEQSTLEVQGNILADQGNLNEALEKYSKQLAITREIGYRHAEASAMNNMALVLKQQDNVTEAKKMWERALVAFHDVSDKSNAATVLINLAGVFLDHGDLVKAEEVYGRALDVFKEVNDQTGVSTAMAGIGTVYFAQGNCPAAKTMLEKAIAIDMAGGRESPPADKLISLADVMQLQGDLVTARKSYQDSLAITRKSDDKSNAAYALFGLAKIALYGADFEEAQTDFDQSLMLRTGLGEKRNVALTQLGQAQLALEQGDLEKAVSLAENARDYFRKIDSIDDQTAAIVVLVRSYLQQGNKEAADRERLSISAQARRSQSLPARLDLAIVNAYVDASKGRNTAPELGVATEQATKAGLQGYEFESRLAIAELCPRTASRGDYSGFIDKLQKDATQKGYVLIGRKAGRLQAAQ